VEHLEHVGEIGDPRGDRDFLTLHAAGRTLAVPALERLQDRIPYIPGKPEVTRELHGGRPLQDDSGVMTTDRQVT
jgi:hypothetical protein